jgi:hypothetical protein
MGVSIISLGASAMVGFGEVQSSKSFYEVYSKGDFEPIPNEVHMIWVGSKPDVVQQKYLLQWAHKNPGSTINLWVDSLHFDTYDINKAVRDSVSELFSDVKEYRAEKLLRGLFSQLESTLNAADTSLNRSAQRQALIELNKDLEGEGRESWREQLIPNGEKVTEENAFDVLCSFKRMVAGNDEVFMLADRMVLDQTVKSWDHCANSKLRDMATLQELQELFSDVSNICIRDISNPSDIQLKNKDVYQHEIVGRNGAYPGASDTARYEILYTYGGVYADIDLECVQSISGVLVAHPDLMLVGLPEAKEGVSRSGTPYVNNNLLASHPGSEMLSRLIAKIGDNYQSLQGNQFYGDRYFSRPNKSIIEMTGPNALRNHINDTVYRSQGREGSRRDDALSLAARIWERDDPQNFEFWEVVESHIQFPGGYVNFDTEEQKNSATSALA